MTHIFLPVAIGIVFSLASFLYFENRAIKAKRSRTTSTQNNSNLSLPENLKRYDTDTNVLYYTLSIFIFTLFFSYFVFFSKGLSLVDVFLYIFLTAFIGSIIILILKINKSILVKVFAAFFYGAPFIGASAFGFIFSYLLYEMFQ